MFVCDTLAIVMIAAQDPPAPICKHGRIPLAVVAAAICGATTRRRLRVRVAKRPLRPAQPVTGASSSLEKLDTLRLFMLHRNSGTLRARNASS